MVDAADSKSASGDRVGVQVPSAVPTRIIFGTLIFASAAEGEHAPRSYFGDRCQFGDF
jgi:hypothetical protein